MSIGYRVFVINPDDTLEQFSHKTYDRFFLEGEPAMPQYAGRRIDIATVLYETKNRRPHRLINIYLDRHTVNDDGSLDESEKRRGMRGAVDRIFSKATPAPRSTPATSTVIQATDLFELRREAHQRAALTPELHNKIVEAIFPAPK